METRIVTKKNLTFNRLVQLDPRLLELVQEAACVNNDADDFCANEIWSERFKPHLMRMVGWLADGTHPDLNSQVAYDIAYGVVYQALPDCKNCLCKAGITALFPGGE